MLQTPPTVRITEKARLATTTIPLQRMRGKGVRNSRAREDHESELGKAQEGGLTHPDDVPEDMGTVERRHGNQVEDHKEGVDEDNIPRQLEKRGGISEAESESEENRDHEAYNEIRGGPGHGHENVIPLGLPEIPGIDRNRLRPSEKSTPS